MEIFIGVMVFLMGLAAGSFVNMLVYRTAVRYGLKKTNDKIRKKKPFGTDVPPFPSQGTTRNRSFCDFCGRQLRWYENIPVISWLVQNGKTRCCFRPLPYSYPLIEIITAGLFLLNYELRITNYELSLLTVVIVLLESVILTMLVFEAEFDRQYMILPDFGIGLLVGCAMILLLGRHESLPLQYIASGLGAFGFMLLLHLITKGKGMGMGDVKLAVFMGLFLGFSKIIVAFYMAFIVGAIYGILMMLRRKYNKKSVMPFGPFLILGTVTAWWWGEEISKFLMSNF